MKIFILDFSKSCSIAQYITKEHKVIEEKVDGGKAYKAVGEFMPDLIFANYDIKRSHVKQTVNAIIQRKKTKLIPIYLVVQEKNTSLKESGFGKLILLDEIENYL